MAGDGGGGNGDPVARARSSGEGSGGGRPGLTLAPCQRAVNGCYAVFAVSDFDDDDELPLSPEDDELLSLDVEDDDPPSLDVEDDDDVEDELGRLSVL